MIMGGSKVDKKPLVGRKCLAVGIILLFVGTCIIPSSAQNTEKTLPPSRGSWLYVGGSGPGNYTKVQDAVDNASDSDTIFVYDDLSPYHENLLNITKSITLIGEDKNTTIIQSSTGISLINVNQENVTIRGFTIKNTSYAYTPAAIYIYSNHCEITDNIFIGNWGGVEINSDYSKITNNNFINNSFGFSIKGSYHCEIKNNFFINHQFGLIVQNYASYCEITDNIFINNRRSMRLRGSMNYVSKNTISHSSNDKGLYVEGNFNNISGNNITSCGYGIFLIGSLNYVSKNTISHSSNGKGLYVEGNFNNISGNNITSCGYGIFLKYSNNNTINNNVITIKCFEGIYVGDSNNNTIRSNLIKANTIGIFLYASKQNYIQNNNFIHNFINAMFHTSNNKWNDNYWTRPRILPKPIIGVSLINFKRIPVIQFDWHPALKPYDIGG